METFVWPIRVYYEDTDSGGVVYYANYLKFLERSRTEWLRHLAIFHTDLEKDDSAFAIHRMSLKYGPPAKIDDLLTVRTTLQKLTGARSFLRQEVLRAEADGREHAQPAENDHELVHSGISLLANARNG